MAYILNIDFKIQSGIWSYVLFLGVWDFVFSAYNINLIVIFLQTKTIFSYKFLR